MNSASVRALYAVHPAAPPRRPSAAKTSVEPDDDGGGGALSVSNRGSLLQGGGEGVEKKNQSVGKWEGKELGSFV